MKPEDRDTMTACLSKNNYRVCESSFATYFLWEEKYKFEICIKDGFLFTRFHENGGIFYLAPAGEGDFTAAFEELSNYCDEQNEPLILAYLTDAVVKQIDESFPDQYDFTPDRDSAEYLYLSERLISLQGKKLHAKRNFINRFKKDFEGRWVFEPIKPENLREVFEYENRWQRDNRTSEGDLEAEKIVIKKLLNNMDYLGSVGGILRLDGKIIGFSLGTEISEDTFDVQIEKADWDIAGAYQVLNNEFAKAFCSGYEYINREEDMGLEGLRKAKLSYDPDEIVMKYHGASKVVSCCVMDFCQTCSNRG
jgi:hypothetical protein